MANYFVVPDTKDSGTGYNRSPANWNFNGDLDIRLRLSAGTGPITVLGVGDVIVWQGPVAQEVLIPRSTLPSGYYVVTAPGTRGFACYVRRVGAPALAGPLVPMCQENMMDTNNKGNDGHTWIPCRTPLPLPAGNKVNPRSVTVWDKLPTPTTRNQLWVRPLTRSNQTWSAIREWQVDEYGNVAIGYYQQYFRTSVQSLASGNLRDGPYGRGGVGTPVAVRQRESDGAIVVTAINGAINLIHPDLTVETVCGWRLKDDAPIPRATENNTMTPAAQAAFIAQYYDVIGTDLLNPFMALPDPDDSDLLWIANTDKHHVVKYKISTHTVLGTCGSPTGVQGHSTTGIGAAVLMRRPRGLAMRPGDGRLWVTQAWNHSVGYINRDTLEYTEVWRSINNWDNYVGLDGSFNTLGTNFYGWTDIHLRDFWEKDGVNGVGSSHHLQQCSFDSQGKLITACDHSRVIKKYDPETGIMSKITDVPAGSYAEQSQKHTAWISLDVNAKGDGEMKDLICYADWGFDRVFKPDGTSAFRALNDPTITGTFFGRNDRVWTLGYPWCAGWVKGGLIVGDSGGERLLHISKRQPTDLDIAAADVGAGYTLWLTPPATGQLSMASIYDDIGHSQLGLIQFQDMVNWPKLDVIEWLRVKRPDWTQAQLDQVYSYIVYSQQPPLSQVPISLPTITNPVVINGVVSATVTDATSIALTATGPGGTTTITIQN